MDYISIKNWERFQHYKDRNPPWIKLHRDLLRDYDFCRLQDASKLHLMLLWLLASQLDNKIPNDPEWIRNQIGIDVMPNLKDLLDQGFIIGDIKALAGRKQDAIVETETETETEAYKEETEKKPRKKTKPFAGEDKFNTFWAEFPKKTDRKKSLETFTKLNPSPELFDVILKAIEEQSGSTEAQFFATADRWLRQEKWTDEITPNSGGNNGFNKKSSQLDIPTGDGTDWDGNF